MTNKVPPQAGQLLQAFHDSSDSEDSDFQKIMTTTRALFRPTVVKKKGRKQLKKAQRTILLLRRKNADFLPTKNEIEYLTECGLGKRKVTFERKFTAEEVEKTVFQLFPEIPLELVGIKLAKIGKDKKLITMINDGMEKLLADNPHGIIVVIPKRDLPVPNNTSDLHQVPSSTFHKETCEQNDSISETVLKSPLLDDNSLPEKLPQDHLEQNYPEQTPSFEFSDELPVSSNIRFGPMINLPRSVPQNEFTLKDGTYELHEMPKLPANGETSVVYINRNNCVTDMLNLYEDKSILDKYLLVEFIGEEGSDFGGLTKELFTLFWKEVEQQYFVGEDCIVPFLPLHRRRERHVFVIMGRILAHTLLLTNTLPIKISRCVYLLFGKKQVEDLIIEEDFLLHVTNSERYLIKKGLNNFKSLDSKELEILTNLFTSYNYLDVPRLNCFKQQIIEIANYILIQNPKYLIEAIMEGFPSSHFQFWEKCDENYITFILAKERPTLQKILDCLITDTLNNDQTKVFHYFQTYMQEIDSDNLIKLIFFITGSSLMPLEINVSFNVLSGVMRRPISHTCSNTIELSAHYNSYQDFKKDMNIYLSSEYSYEYTNI